MQNITDNQALHRLVKLMKTQVRLADLLAERDASSMLGQAVNSRGRSQRPHHERIAMQRMTDDYARKLDELDRLLNDPNVPMQPALIWRLLDEISKHEADTMRQRADVIEVTALEN
jgi:hypothetical protein